MPLLGQMLQCRVYPRTDVQVVAQQTGDERRRNSGPDSWSIVDWNEQLQDRVNAAHGQAWASEYRGEGPASLLGRSAVGNQVGSQRLARAVTIDLRGIRFL